MSTSAQHVVEDVCPCRGRLQQARGHRRRATETSSNPRNAAADRQAGGEAVHPLERGARDGWGAAIARLPPQRLRAIPHVPKWQKQMAAMEVGPARYELPDARRYFRSSSLPRAGGGRDGPPGELATSERCCCFFGIASACRVASKPPHSKEGAQTWSV